MNATRARWIISLIVLILMGNCSGEEGAKSGATVWGSRGKQPGRFGTPRAILARQGAVYVIDRTGRVQKFDEEGTFLLQWTLEKIDNGAPTGIAVDAAGDVWIPDTHNSRILHYHSDGTFVSSFGEYGKEPGKFIFPTDIAIGDKGELFIAEYGEIDRIQVFTPEGHYLRGWGEYGSGEGQFNRAMGIVKAKDGQLYIADSVNSRVVVCSQAGEFLRQFGHKGSAKGEMSFPYGIDADEEGNIYVCEYGNNRLQKFSPAGQSLGTWGRLGDAVGELAQPWGVTVDNGKVFAADSKNHRIQVISVKDFH